MRADDRHFVDMKMEAFHHPECLLKQHRKDKSIGFSFKCSLLTYISLFFPDVSEHLHCSQNNTAYTRPDAKNECTSPEETPEDKLYCTFGQHTFTFQALWQTKPCEDVGEMKMKMVMKMMVLQSWRKGSSLVYTVTENPEVPRSVWQTKLKIPSKACCRTKRPPPYTENMTNMSDHKTLITQPALLPQQEPSPLPRPQHNPTCLFLRSSESS